jgi:hypothetical protein
VEILVILASAEYHIFREVSAIRKMRIDRLSVLVGEEYRQFKMTFMEHRISASVLFQKFLKLSAECLAEVKEIASIATRRAKLNVKE